MQEQRKSLSKFSIGSLIDALCDEFEKSWKAGESPKIEDYLRRVGEEARTSMFRDLLTVEVELRRNCGEPVSTSDYLGRFPGLETLVVQICG